MLGVRANWMDDWMFDASASISSSVAGGLEDGGVLTRICRNLDKL